jgi:hypothetical protein
VERRVVRQRRYYIVVELLEGRERREKGGFHTKMEQKLRMKKRIFWEFFLKKVLFEGVLKILGHFLGRF